MGDTPIILVLSGGLSNEREVSLISGKEIASALEVNFPVERVVLDDDSLPVWIDPECHVVFPALHGAFGEDGGLQSLLEQKNIHYAGSDARSSAQCMDKVVTKMLVACEGVRTPRDLHFPSGMSTEDVASIVRAIGSSLVIKPINQGSSCGVSFAESTEDLGLVLPSMGKGSWMIEERIRGREFSVGILNGKAMGVVEIIPHGQSYDYKHKYTPGTTEYVFPAQIESSLELELKSFSETAFRACACRDFARADFMATEDGKAYFLEINTIPGLTPTSLLPKSAHCNGLDFPSLARLMVEPLIRRFYESVALVKAQS